MEDHPVDIFRIMRPTLEERNSFHREEGIEVEEKFQNLPQGDITLEDLIKSDIKWLMNKSNIDDISTLDDITITEIPCRRIRRFSKSMPLRIGEASLGQDATLEFKLARALKNEIFFQTPLLHLTHSFLSKAELLICDDWIQNGVPADDHLGETIEYSDISLLHGIFRDMFSIYILDTPYTPLSPRHILDAYNFTERVVGARIFLVAREIAANIAVNIPIDDWFNQSTEYEGDDLRDAWIEFNADQMAIKLIISRYPAGELSDSELYEFENYMVGIHFLFAMHHIAYSACADLGRERISLLNPEDRIVSLRNQLMNSRVARDNPKIANVIKHKIISIISLRKVLAGKSRIEQVNIDLKNRLALEPALLEFWSNYVNSYESE